MAPFLAGLPETEMWTSMIRQKHRFLGLIISTRPIQRTRSSKIVLRHTRENIRIEQKVELINNSNKNASFILIVTH